MLPQWRDLEVLQAHQAGTGRDRLPDADPVEVKCRAAGFRQLYDRLAERDVLIVKSDRQEPLVVVRLSLAAEIAKKAAA